MSKYRYKNEVGEIRVRKLFMEFQDCVEEMD